MRRFALIALVVLVATGAAAQEQPSPYRVYLQDRTIENFMKAVEHYSAASADSLDLGSTVVLAYLHLLELDRNLEILAAHEGEMKGRTKFSYANVLLELGRYDEAIPLYEELNEKTPKWSCPWRHKGQAYWKKGDLDAAVASLKKAIETRETHYDAYVMLAEVQRDLKQYDEALATLEKGLTFYGKDIENPQEEVGDADVYFLYLDLLKKNGRADTELYHNLLEKVKEAAPNDKRLEECMM